MSDSLTIAGNPPQTVTFDQIPNTLRDPRNVSEIRPNYGNVGLLLLPSKALIIGNMLAGGAGTPLQPYPITGPGQAEALWGAGSVVATKVNAWMANNTTTPLFAIGVPDAAGATKASQTINLGNASFSGGFSCTVWVGTQFQAPVVVPAGATQSDLANAILANINASPSFPVTAALVAGGSNVLVTAKNAGLTGNDIPLLITNRSDASAPIISIGVGPAGSTAASANLAGGLGNPSLAPVLEGVAATWYTDIDQPWNDPTNYGAYTAELVRRYGALVNLDARGYLAIGGSYATVVGEGDAGNCIQLVTWPVRGTLDPIWCWASALGAIHAFRLANDPSRQSRGIAVVGLTAPADGNIWTPEERDLLLHNGLSTFTGLNDGTVVVGRTVTGYLQSTEGVADAAWLDVMTPATMTAIRYDWDAYVDLVYQQAKLFPDGSLGAEYDDTAATPKRMSGSWMKRGQDYARAGWISSAAPAGYTLNPSDKNRLDGQPGVVIAGNLFITASVLEFAA